MTDDTLESKPRVGEQEHEDMVAMEQFLEERFRFFVKQIEPLLFCT
jgi:hypothetical protein